MSEEVVIADSVERLVEVPVARKRIVVIDDSDDATPRILAGIDHPDLFVLRRDKPDAQKGKAAGLNYAYRALHEYGDRGRTIVAIVDADGRLHPDAPLYAASHFADPRSVASSRWSDVQPRQPADLAAGCRNSPSTGTSSRPVATAGERPGWAATASSIG
jgi:cellulose synthase/poly-beta-1,6-N-acetylglucosamine synthase-like glycosyltransferase